MFECVWNFIKYIGLLIESMLTVFLHPVVFIPLLIYVLVLKKKIKIYKEGSYYKLTNKPYFVLRRNLGAYGEYLIYDYLKKYEELGAKFLFNIYLPKENGETTEIDVLMITTKGLFVFESKNYSGWIFGSEAQKNWYQTLPAGRGHSHKEVFYNPILQNKTHIKVLKSLLGNDIFTYSIIAFSDRCELMKVRFKSDNLSVVNRFEIKRLIPYLYENLEDTLSFEQINEIYNNLYSFTKLTEEDKQKHIDDINNRLAKTNNINAIGEDNVIDENVKLKEDICPLCGGDLLKRKGRYGMFVGCSKYPKCRFTKK